MERKMEFEMLKVTNERYKVFSTDALRTVATVEAALLRGARKYLDKNGFLEVVVPHVVEATGSCEIIETLFTLPYFEQSAYLTQTAQLYLEALVPFLGGKVYTFGPSFRAESRVDDRHLTEFSLLELEFEGDFQKLLSTVEQIFLSMTEEAYQVLGKSREFKIPFRRISYKEAVNKLGLSWGMDIHAVDEKKLLEENNNQPFFLTHFPKSLKYFNMRENDDDSRIVNSADFIVPYGGECVGAAEREHNPTNLLRRLKESAMYINYVAQGGNPHSFDWYLDAYFRYHYKLHSGFGMGLNRVTKFVLELDDIRQTTVYPVNRETLY